MVGTTVQATDTTTVSDGLLIEKYQQTTACNMTPSATLTLGIPNAPWSKNAIASGPATAPGQCISYLIVATNKTNGALTAITLSDTLPTMNPVLVLNTGCGAATAGGSGSPTAPTGTGGLTTGSTGTVSTTVATLGSTQSFTLQFCTMINNM
jgi:uncharacterized repeat protein (TIGR01451 family)